VGAGAAGFGVVGHELLAWGVADVEGLVCQGQRADFGVDQFLGVQGVAPYVVGVPKPGEFVAGVAERLDEFVQAWVPGVGRRPAADSPPLPGRPSPISGRSVSGLGRGTSSGPGCPRRDRVLHADAA